ncbi:hypothetical protein [Azonexus fungiphilus]|uniref:hypothetical protein n=1 Tax=Azonexus fungiphilus TaxID=146940 RepID=UPI00156B2083|nr:hypothetical protein [Azonexus fungiphilus]NHC08355.1 hypothetical protein [Azonexus fungiphilus]
MRLYEFASAEEQLALFKLISDSVWQSLSIQQKQQAEEEAARLRAANAKPKGSVKSKLRKHYTAPKLAIPKSPQSTAVPSPAPTSAFVQKPPVTTKITALLITGIH